MNMVWVMVTDVGDFPCPPDIIELAKKAKLRKDRRPDMRTRTGRELRAAERAFCDSKLKEWAA